MRYYLYVLHDGYWQLKNSFSSQEQITAYCSSFYDMIRNRINITGNDTRNIPDVYWDKDGIVYQIPHYYPRDLLVLDEDSRIIDPRPLLAKHAVQEPPWLLDHETSKKRRHYCKSGKSSWGSRRLKHYKQSLKDQSWEKLEMPDWHLKTPYRTPNAWDLEPPRRNSACWKDQSKRRHQYKRKPESDDRF